MPVKLSVLTRHMCSPQLQQGQIYHANVEELYKLWVRDFKGWGRLTAAFLIANGGHRFFAFMDPTSLARTRPALPLIGLPWCSCPNQPREATKQRQIDLKHLRFFHTVPNISVLSFVTSCSISLPLHQRHSMLLWSQKLFCLWLLIFAANSYATETQKAP